MVPFWYPLTCPTIAHSAQLSKADTAFLSIKVSCWWGKSCCCPGRVMIVWLKSPKSLPALITKWSWRLFSEWDDFEGTFLLQWRSASETVPVAHLGGWIHGRPITISSLFLDSHPHYPPVFHDLHLYFQLGLFMVFCINPCKETVLFCELMSWNK